MLDQITRPVEQALQTQPVAAKKNIILLSDGTGNSAASVWRTNVWRTFQALDLTGSDQIAIYDDGVGTSSFKPLALIGGAFGYGLKRNVLDLYAFLCRNYEPGVDIFAFGFSRGAYTIRVVTGLIESQGLLEYESEAELRRNVKSAYRAYRAERFHTLLRVEYPLRRLRDAFLRLRDRWDERRKNWKPYAKLGRIHPVQIRFLGLWDTVAAYGSPIEELTTTISQWIWPLELPNREPSEHIRRACHALAIDDERTTFHPLIWSEKHVVPALPRRGPKGKFEYWVEDERISQVWFSGVHSNVGGGYPDDALAYIPFYWILTEARKCGLRLKENPPWGPAATGPFDPVHDPDMVRQARSGRDKDGRLYDSRRGFGGYYRYGPRKIHDLCNVARSWISPYEVEVAIPKIHCSVFERIKNGAHGYAPACIPGKYAVVNDEGRILEPADNPYESCEQAKKRAEVQEHVWDRVWHRRVNYFLTLFVTAGFVLFPLIVRKPDVTINADTGAASWAAFLSPVIELAGSFLPGFAKSWVDIYAGYPAWFAGLGVLVAALVQRGVNLGTQINDAMRTLWTLNLSQWEPLRGSKPTSRVFRLRTKPWYPKLIGATKRHVIPFMLLIALVYGGFVGLNRAAFTVANSLGLVCHSTSIAALRPVPHTAESSLATRSPCWASGIHLEQGVTYQIAIETGTPWSDDGIATTPHGFGLAEMTWPMYPAQALKRDFDANWFQPIARIGGHGLDEHRLTMVQDKVRRARYTATVTPRHAGELFLFVNDVEIGLPWLTHLFYLNNHGDARVTVERATE